MADAIGFKPTSVNVHGLTALIRLQAAMSDTNRP